MMPNPTSTSICVLGGTGQLLREALFLCQNGKASNRHITLYQTDVTYGKIATITPQRRDIVKLVVSHPAEKVERRIHA
jgi:hypothetical protein